VCNRSIWVDEDLRIASAACSQALIPPCATSCPANFTCSAKPPLRCLQDPCTCHIIVDPASLPRLNGNSNITGMPGSGLPTGFGLPPNLNATLPAGLTGNASGVPPAVPPGFPLPPGFSTNNSQSNQNQAVQS
jgi:hypothetical protein